METISPGPPRVQIQTKAGCNGRCVFCPNGQLIEAGLEQGTMSAGLFHEIVDQLAETPPRRIGLYLMNEPLLDERLPGFVRLVTDRIPTAKTQVISNGTRLTDEWAENLIDAGLRQLKVSLQSLDPKVNERLMGHSSSRVVENCIRTQEIIRKKKAKRLDFRVSMVVTKANEGEIEEARGFWAKQGIRLVTSALENRGGNIGDAENLNPHAMQAMADCIRPSRDFMILFNGDVPLCCVDWFRTAIVGNVTTERIRDIWHGEALEEIRDALRKGEVGRLPKICANCGESARPDHHRRGVKGILSRLLKR